ncbi:MvdC/MvdD family ATP grasp protein [Aquimarina sp. AU119]|uniref:MvdC/MvdD family ATP grasp protein n=1 Tax=Aquimarina sp. AU119 TaxID=2108528 RepID=UPI000D68E691|nr:hypothetical protein [Aquimarina sp. AU119]
MILIITHKEDFTADYVIEKLNKKGIEYFRLNCEDIDKYNYQFRNSNSFNFIINNIRSFDSVWFRRSKLPDIQTNNEAEKLFLLSDYESLFDNIYYLIDSKKWLSHPRYVYAAENKILQLNTAKSIGFKIPDTLISNNKLEFKTFASANNNSIIIKPIRQGRIKEKNGFKSIFTNKVGLDKIQRVENFDLTPCIFQEYIEKEYEIRVTVVDKKVFSAKVDSQINEETKVDWRKKKIPFEKYLLPPAIVKKCITITESLNLSFGAIDLIKTIDGEYVFLEINPNGQWAWLEMEADLKISDEIINYLTTVK